MIGKFIGGVLVWAVFVCMFETWLVMLTAGALHSLIFALPAISFGQSIIVTVALAMLLGLGRGGKQ